MNDQKISGLRLSEAIRLGAMINPQGRGSLSQTRRKYFFGLIGPKAQETCALGAAFEATGARGVVHVSDGSFRTRPFRGELGVLIPAGVTYVTIDTPWPVANESRECPQCGLDPQPLWRLIPHLNDIHNWTRERIADFVETIERAAEPTPELSPVLQEKAK